MANIVFEKVGERDIDLLIMHAFESDPQFCQLFFDQLGWYDCNISHIEHSLTDPELGESDITVIVQCGNDKRGLLIENKIDAEAQPDQYLRYIHRGNRGVSLGKYCSYAVFITAPQLYLSTDSEAKKYPYSLPYETMLSFFEGQRANFECTLLRAAIQKKERGYTVLEVSTITKFWEELYTHVKAGKYAVDMYKPTGPKGSHSTWVQFRTPLQGTALYYKSRNKSGYGFVDLEFTGKWAERDRLKTDLFDHLEDGMQWENTGHSLSLRIKVNEVDFNEPFEKYINEIDLVLVEVERLTTFAVKLNNLGYRI